MKFNRYCLSYSINSAYKESKACIYFELSNIFYRLLEQEKLKKCFILNFHFYEYISDDTKNYYMDCVNYLSSRRNQL